VSSVRWRVESPGCAVFEGMDQFRPEVIVFNAHGLVLSFNAWLKGLLKSFIERAIQKKKMKMDKASQFQVRVQGSGLGGYGAGCRAQGLGFRVVSFPTLTPGEHHHQEKWRRGTSLRRNCPPPWDCHKALGLVLL